MHITCLTFATVVIDNEKQFGFSWSYQNEGVCNNGARRIELQAFFAGAWTAPVVAVTDDFGNLVQVRSN